MVMKILNVTETVTQHLRDLIISNTFKAGQKLSEVELSARFNVSRVPMREAFHVLENEQLLVRVPRKGAYVAELSIDRMRQVYSARKMIESYAIDLLEAGHIRKLPKVHASLIRVPTSSVSGRTPPPKDLTYLQSITDFHVQLVASTGNPWLINFYHSIASNLARFQFYCGYTPGLSSESHNTHEKVYELLTSGLYENAKEVLMAHIDYTMGFIENHIKEETK